MRNPTAETEREKAVSEWEILGEDLYISLFQYIGICFYFFSCYFYLFLEALCLNLWGKMKLLYHFVFILCLVL